MPTPGDVNAHTHIYSGLAPFGLPALQPPPSSFIEILRRVWWRLDRALDERSLRASARYYVASALLRGTTTLIDHHESPELIEGSLDILADACHELGIRALLCYGATERNRGLDEALAGLTENKRFIQKNTRPLVRGAIGLHASFTLGDEAIRRAAELATELAVPVHVHMAEDRIDIDDARERGYQGPLERLLSLGALPPGSILAHGVHLDPQRIRLCNAQGLWLVQNTRSNQNNRVGYPSALCHSQHVALGTDGFPSDMREEMATLRDIAPHFGEDPSVARERLAAGHTLAAGLFGADFASQDELVRTDDPGAPVDQLVIAGRPVVRHGRLLTGDFDTILAEAKEQAARLFERMQSIGETP